jgi:hypothetical protein
MRVPPGVLALPLTACSLLPAQSFHHGNPAAEKLSYDVEWRLINAGSVTVESHKTYARMTIESAGLVSSLFKINDTYTVNYDEPFCATSSLMDAQEGKRHREAAVTYDRSLNRATFVERDLIKDMVLHTYEVAIPNCVHDVVTAIMQLRTQAPEPGQSAQLPMSDGRHSAAVKIEAQEREDMKTPAGSFKAIRYEAYMLNGVIYTRKGRVFIWLTDDERRLPVQIKLRMPFPVGTVTLQLRKGEGS